MSKKVTFYTTLIESIVFINYNNNHYFHNIEQRFNDINLLLLAKSIV